MKISHLTQCMDTCIRPAGAMNLHRPACQTRKNSLQLSLNRLLCVALLLPPVITGSRRTVIKFLCSFLPLILNPRFIFPSLFSFP